MRKYLIILASIFISTYITAQNPGETIKPLTPAEKKEVIDSFSSLLKNNYIFPEVAEKMNQLIAGKLSKGDYNNITDPVQFAQQLTTDLQSVSKDKHLRAGYNPQVVKELRSQSGNNNDEVPVRFLEQMRASNYGFSEVKLLPGNIGYLDLRGFVDAKYGSETAVAAMNFLSNADALIIDLRQNGGGSPSMIQLITSYLYGPEPVHLNNFYFRPTNENTQTWTLPYVPGKRRPDVPVYILTSNRTFSAAEEFTYNLKNLKRATIVGETTGGGAHPGGTLAATDRFTLWVPKGRAINPITNTNWEGAGVEPDIKIVASNALETAQIKALEKLASSKSSQENRYNWLLARLKAKQNPVTVDETTLKSYTGNYGPRTISFDGGQLYYQRTGNPKYKLRAISNTLFEAEGLDYFRINFIVENNKATALEGLYDDGNRDKNMKEK
ncbi:MAG TPA: S41 family peptidase [Chitinophagaceae bacterium]|nr:S41 family peptidase [Chitinophagaceae bacterium]